VLYFLKLVEGKYRPVSWRRTGEISIKHKTELIGVSPVFFLYIPKGLNKVLIMSMNMKGRK